jgi:hypothetical protein
VGTGIIGHPATAAFLVIAVEDWDDGAQTPQKQVLEALN